MHVLDGFVSPVHAARRLNVAGSTLRAMVRAGRLPATRTPLGIIIQADDLEQFAKRRAEARSENGKGQYGSKAQE
jgi:excisionase family DNA binding protein